MEREFISWLRERLPPHPLLRLGVGDDAAILQMVGVDQCVMTVDMLADGVDFHLNEVAPNRVGRKALAVNLSDLAAMAAEPLAAVVAVMLPRQNAAELAVALYEGMLPLAERYHLAIAGGDTNTWGGPLSIAVTLLGKVTENGALRRDGARPGDRILVTGSFGGSIEGHHLDFEPRVRESLLLNAHYELHAGTDVSDGLSLDLSHIMAESHCGAILDAKAIPVSEAACRCSARLADGSTPLQHALGDGEDFELIMAVPPQEAQRILKEQPLDVPIADIGHFTAERGLWLQDETNQPIPLNPQGWQY